MTTDWSRVREIIRKEILQVLREPRLRMLLIVPPMIQLIIFGYAANLDVERSSLAWLDWDQTPESRELRAEFEGSGRFQVKFFPRDEVAAGRLLDAGDCQTVVQVLPGFARDIHRGKAASVQVLIDGSNSNTASVLSGYAAQIVARYARRVLARQAEVRLAAQTLTAGVPVRVSLPQLQSRPRVWFNSDLKSRYYYVPGVVVNIIALITIMLTAMSIVREKEIGTMEQLMVTPIRPFELMLGKILPFAAVGLLEVVLVTGAALLVFGVPFRGGALMLLGASVLFLLTTLGIGLFISTVSHTQPQAMMASFFFFLPAFSLSGFTFPIRNMPEIIQYLTYLNPLRYILEIVRNIFLKGSGPEVFWPQMLALLVYGVTVFSLSALRFRKRLD